MKVGLLIVGVVLGAVAAHFIMRALAVGKVKQFVNRQVEHLGEGARDIVRGRSGRVAGVRIPEAD